MQPSFISNRAQRLSVSPIREFFERALRTENVIRLEIGEPDFPVAEHVKEAARRAIDQDYSHYTSNAGLMELRRSIAAKMARENEIRVDPEKEVVVTNGGTSAIYLALLATVNPGDEVLLPDPGWPQYTSMVELAEGVPVYYPLLEKDAFALDVSSMESRLSPRTRLILLNSPSNPTGGVTGEDQLQALARMAREREILILADEVYEKIIYEGRHRSIAGLEEARGRTITVNACSKTYAMTGWRVGYAVAPAEIAAQITKLMLYTNCCANSLAQKAVIEAFEGPEDYIHEMVREYRRRRDFLVEGLNRTGFLSCLKPPGSFYLFPNISATGLSSLEFANLLLQEARVSSVPGNGFGPHGEGYVRFCYACSHENLEEALRRITKLKSILGQGERK